jgi:dipeptidase E
MKLLLTSTGITNESIENKFVEMVGKKTREIHLAYISTAINISSVDDKRWAIDNLRRLDDIKIGVIDIVDIAATPKDNWLPKLKRADAIFVEGGNPGYLEEQFIKNNFITLIKNELADKLYVGCSAGSSILGKITIKSAPNSGYKKLDGFGLVAFSIRPHFYRADRTQFTEEMVSNIAKKYNSDFYAIDDSTAIAIEDSKIEVISEGKWKKFNQDV